MAGSTGGLGGNLGGDQDFCLGPPPRDAEEDEEEEEEPPRLKHNLRIIYL